MASYSELITLIKADNKDFNQKINSSRSLADKFGKDMLKFGGIAATAIGVAAVGGFAALLHVINETTDSVSDLVDTANRLGGSVAGLQKLQYAASLSGVSAEQLESGMVKLAKSLLGAEDNSSKAAKSLKDLGLSAKDLTGLSLDEQYLKVAVALGDVSDKAKQNEIAFNLFGRSGIAQLAFIRDGVKEATDEFDRLGGSLTGEQAGAIDAYGDAITKLNATFAVFSTQMTAAVAPALTEFLGYIQQSIIDAGGLGEIGKTTGLFLVDGITLAVNAFQGLLNIIQNVRIGFLDTKIAALELIQAVSNTKFAIGGGDFNFDRSMSIAQAKQDRSSILNQNTDVTSGLVSGLNNARSAVDGTNTKDKLLIELKYDKDGFVNVITTSSAFASRAGDIVQKLASQEARKTTMS